ncbi:MAG: hypothetical protein EAX87_13250 [Candidatus Thorarchaeota archaeon]|nr:hypothetical protein [Candidatus Thorarchaeota archaeon]
MILKKPALLELARRKDTSLMDYCETLLSSEDYERWLLGIDALVVLGTPDAVDRLILVYAKSLNDERKYVLSMVARILTAEHVKPFSIMVREVACPGELDVSGWTKTAISTLKDVCKRFGIGISGEVCLGIEPKGSHNPDAMQIDEISTIDNKR